MSELDEAMSDHINHIVHSEHRPFSYLDFLSFEQNGKQYGMKHGTFRNKISKRKKLNQVEVCYHDFLTFYTLKGVRFAKPMTADHTVVHHNSDPLYKILQNLPLDRQSIHDIRLKFRVPNIWKMFSFNAIFPINKRSKDIIIPAWSKNNAIVGIMIHKTDLVSVIIGCSSQPIPLDINGIIRFFTLLVRVEEKIQAYLDNSIPTFPDKLLNSIPEFKSWIVTMWHFGRDALTEYAGERFSYTIEDAQHILTRMYVKDFNCKKRIRIEIPEYPKKPLEEAIREKIYGLTNKTD